MGRREIHIEMWWGNLLENGCLEDRENSINVPLRKIGYEDERWMESARDCVQ
jgi:hypothetical protein